MQALSGQDEAPRQANSRLLWRSAFFCAGRWRAPSTSTVGNGMASRKLKLSPRAQKFAAVPEYRFEGMLGEWRERVSVG